MKISASFFLAILFCVAVCAQFPPIGTIDFYGLRTIQEKQVRDRLPVKEGDAAFASKAASAGAEKRIAEIPQIAEVRISQVCCGTDGKTIVYVGVREKGTPPLKFRSAPQGAVRLPDSIVKIGREYADAHEQAVLKGDVAEDRSAGHSLMKNPRARAVQEKFIPLAGENLDLLRQVLRESALAEHRALAAEIIAYYKDKSAVTRDLVEAMKDAESGVRNNAMRALGLIAGYAFAHPEKNISVPFEPFVELLNSLDWTDRNKSALALSELTEKRNSELLELIRRRSLSSVIEMALWKDNGHAGMPFIILGRAAGFSDDEIMKALVTNNRRDMIAGARKKLQPVR